MKKLVISLFTFLAIAGRVSADEGMWLLPLLEKMNIKQMKQQGLKLSASDIYNTNGNSIKDAIVIFGNGCTGEIVSGKGLLLTNHHCGFGSIQSLSSVQNDYLKNGFWAMNSAEELPAPGLSVKFIRKIEDVTDRVLNGVTEEMSHRDRVMTLSKNKDAVETDLQSKNPDMTVLVKDFFGANQYIAFVIEVYTDVRLVGTPPTSIGKFGGDTDNWMWPRHTGDFSMFRVYSNKDGRPAKYSKDNIPYNSPTHLKVSLKGYNEGDFAMIMGFPGTTERYMTSFEIDQTVEVDNPVRIFVRGERQDILAKDMASSDKIRIQYASKYASSSNYWKNSIGMNRGLKRLNVKEKKQALEAEFTAWALASDDRKIYTKALPLIQKAVEQRREAAGISMYLNEALARGTELLLASTLATDIRDTTFVINDESVAKLKRIAAGFYKDFNAETDRKVAKAMFKIVGDSVEQQYLPDVYSKVIATQFKGNIDAYVDYLYDNSFFVSKEKFDAFMNEPTAEKVKADPAFVAYLSVMKRVSQMRKATMKCTTLFNEGHRLFIAGLMKMQNDKKHYPDANFTIRLSYGNILPYQPADAVQYDYYTTLSGVIAKEDPSNPVEFTVPGRLKELYKAKDFGQYAHKGDIPVAFLSNNDITGGNSGSPIMNSRGELLGLAFDGNWEAMSGDIAFEPALQRTINVDIRYVLFIVDKFAGAGYLLDEMTIVK